MKLIGNLKKQVEETKNKEVIEKAGMELTDEELDLVTGGEAVGPIVPKVICYCDICHENSGPQGGWCDCGGTFTLKQKPS